MRKAKRIGVDKAIRNLRKTGADGERYLKATIQSTADQVVVEAKQNAPKDTGQLAQSIGKQSENDNLKANIFINADYWGFIEFGTGGYVSVPADLQETAAEFRGYKNGDFAEFLRNMKEWCKRKGIGEKFAYIICVSILRKGIKPQPFLYPALKRAKDGIVKKLLEARARIIKQNK